MTWLRCWPLSVLLTIGLAMPLAGCGSGRSREERDERLNIYPANFRTDLLAAFHAYVNDPTHIRDAYVSEPVLSQIGRQKRYAACVRFNARNDGRYVGSRDAVAVFSAGRFDQFIDESTQPGQGSQADPTTFVKELCGAAEYKRFPELEAMTR